MKKLSIAFFILFGLSIGNSAYSQVCEPDTNFKSTGSFPTQLAPADLNTPYEQTIQFRIPKDTTINFNGTNVSATLDSAVITEVMGIPANFVYTCYNANCAFYPEITSCGILTGMAEAGQQGTYPIKIAIVFYGKAFGIAASQADTIERYTLEINGGTASLRERSQEFNPVIFPNPSNQGIFTLKWSNPEKHQEIQITDIYGKVVYAAEAESFSNNLDINLSDKNPAKGIYFVNIKGQKNSSVIKLIIQ